MSQRYSDESFIWKKEKEKYPLVASS